MSKRRLPSLAQAKEIALLWCGHRNRIWLAIEKGHYRNPTWAALVKYGWVSATGEMDNHPNGEAIAAFRLNDTGTDALQFFLMEKAYKRQIARTA